MVKLVAVVMLIIAVALGIGVSLYIIPELLPFLDEQTRIIIGVVLSLFAFVALYFMSKGNN